MKRKLLILFIMLPGITAFGQVKIIAHRGASFFAPENTDMILK